MIRERQSSKKNINIDTEI